MVNGYEVRLVPDLSADDKASMMLVIMGNVKLGGWNKIVYLLVKIPLVNASLPVEMSGGSSEC